MLLMAPSVGGWNCVPHGVGRDQRSGSSRASDGRSSSPSPRSHHSLNEAWVRMSAPVSSAQPGGAAEVVGVAVGDHHGVDPRQRHVGPRQPVEQAVPRLRSGQPGVDDGEAALVLERVAVDVTESGEHDRQLHPQDAGCDLGDLLGGGLLLLLREHIGRVRCTRIDVPARATTRPRDCQRGSAPSPRRRPARARTIRACSSLSYSAMITSPSTAMEPWIAQVWASISMTSPAIVACSSTSSSRNSAGGPCRRVRAHRAPRAARCSRASRR